MIANKHPTAYNSLICIHVTAVLRSLCIILVNKGCPEANNKPPVWRELVEHVFRAFLKEHRTLWASTKVQGSLASSPPLLSGHDRLVLGAAHPDVGRCLPLFLGDWYVCTYAGNGWLSARSETIGCIEHWTLEFSIHWTSVVCFALVVGPGVQPMMRHVLCQWQHKPDEVSHPLLPLKALKGGKGDDG